MYKYLRCRGLGVVSASEALCTRHPGGYLSDSLESCKEKGGGKKPHYMLGSFAFWTGWLFMNYDFINTRPRVCYVVMELKVLPGV